MSTTAAGAAAFSFMEVIYTIKFYLVGHTAIVGFQWNITQCWDSTWLFLYTSMAIYVLHLLISLILCRRTTIRLGPSPPRPPQPRHVPYLCLHLRRAPPSSKSEK
ncbi:hypothetical protein PIB30_053551 [Stylosanthes scabra]|uniref:Uncharacterized protein n=1 Tax=Stylosanthes scabra TaxID=79078 RepID=A0ABU6ZHD2_9FABA|nr:hypothetical protein [Stylosanthes scabra]